MDGRKGKWERQTEDEVEEVAVLEVADFLAQHAADRGRNEDHLMGQSVSSHLAIPCKK